MLHKMHKMVQKKHCSWEKQSTNKLKVFIYEEAAHLSWDTKTDREFQLIFTTQGSSLFELAYWRVSALQ